MKNFFAVCIASLLVTHVVTASAKEGAYITG
ncbi:adhesin/invasin protein PagN, partial [Salmonella enterica]